MISKRIRFYLLIAIMSIIIAGCTPGCETDTTIEISYISELSMAELEELRNLGEGESLSVAQFKDSRREIGIAGAKNPVGNIAVRYNPTKPVGELVRDTLIETFEDMGFAAQPIGLWDLEPNTLRDIATTIAMGGDIKIFWAENRPRPGQYSSGGTGFSEVRILFVLANPETQKIVWQGEITGGVTRSTTGFFATTPNLKEMLDQAFSQTIDRLLTNQEFLKAIEQELK